MNIDPENLKRVMRKHEANAAHDRAFLTKDPDQ